MQLQYYHECDSHLQCGLGKVYSMHYTVNKSEVSAPVAHKVEQPRRK